jgi:signal transduction histidine kinase
MKIRTKLVLLLSTALVVTTGFSTYLRLRWTRARLEERLLESARETADAISVELQKRLTPDTDSDERVGVELAEVMRRHPVVADLEWAPDSDEDVSKTFSLAPSMDEPLVKKRPRNSHVRTDRVRREDLRRALYDHGQSTRLPGQRTIEPLWRTPDRMESSRWPSRAVSGFGSPSAQAHIVRAGSRGNQRVYEVRVPVDPDGPLRGELTIAVTREPIEQLIRTEKISSVLITGAAILVLVVLTTIIVNRVVGRPVSELEQAMTRVEGGALAERVEPRRSDEVGALSRGFNAMLGRLAAADAEIRAFNRRLAEEVAAATADLARKNDALGQLNRLLVEMRQELGDKERLAALGQLAAQLAHEIGTPLGSVSGHLQLALSRRDLPPALEERLQVAGREIERISKIVRDYLDSTRPVAPARVPVRVDKVVDEALGIIIGVEGGTQAAAQVVIEKKLEAAFGPIETDPGLLRQILLNLFTNATDAVTAFGGSPGAGHIWVHAERRSGFLELTVRDDGIGIAPEDAARIFEPFYTTKGRGKGTGLGLAICRELTTALGGQLTVESAPGHGSTFRLLLPTATTLGAEKAEMVG